VCAPNQPLYCDNGNLTDRADLCGCPPTEFIVNTTSCEKLTSNPKIINLSYWRYGEVNLINFTVFGGLAKYQSQLSPYYECPQNRCPSDDEIEGVIEYRNINEPKQQEHISDLVKQIESITSDKMSQARIAISLVQRIPYDENFSLHKVCRRVSNTQFRCAEETKYPYRVLYDNLGVCSEKSRLLVAILKEIGFETVMFIFEDENHQAVGVKCPVQYSFRETGYCFVETTVPSIITDSMSAYSDTNKYRPSPANKYGLYSNPKILKTSSGIGFDGTISDDYMDAKKYDELKQKDKWSEMDYDVWQVISKRYGIFEITFIRATITYR